MHAPNHSLMPTCDQLILCLIFHLARLFLLPILRLRLGFAIYFSTNRQKTLP